MTDKDKEKGKKDPKREFIFYLFVLFLLVVYIFYRNVIYKGELFTSNTKAEESVTTTAVPLSDENEQEDADEDDTIDANEEQMKENVDKFFEDNDIKGKLETLTK